jgi:hypothetical protein
MLQVGATGINQPTNLMNVQGLMTAILNLSLKKLHPNISFDPALSLELTEY